MGGGGLRGLVFADDRDHDGGCGRGGAWHTKAMATGVLGGEGELQKGGEATEGRNLGVCNLI